MDDTDKIITLNGFKNITAEFSKPSDPTSLIVNGALFIEDSNKKQLDQYKNVIVNGVIILPYSFDTSWLTTLEENAEDAKALAAVEELYVTGNVHIDDGLINIFLEKHPKYKELLTFSGELIDINDMEFCVDNKFLKNINTCATLNFLNSNVEISPEVSSEIISEKIHKIYLNDSTLTIGLNQQNILRRKIHNTNGDVLLREFENTEEIVPNEPYKKDFIETRVNCSYYKL